MGAARIVPGLVLIASAACGAPDDALRTPVGGLGGSSVSAPSATTTTVPPAAEPATGATLPSTSTTSTTSTTTTTTTVSPTSQPPTSGPASTAVAAGPTTTLPGTPFDPPFHPAGAVLDVAGVGFDQVLAVRSLPGADQPVLATLPPLARGVVSTGRAQVLAGGGGGWLEVDAAGVTGWVPISNLAYLGARRDITAEVVSTLGRVPRAPTMLELGNAVVDAEVPTDPAAPPPLVVLVEAPAGGSPSTAVFDTFPGEFFGDDASVGTRYVVVGRQVAGGEDLPATGFASSLVYELVRVEEAHLCARGGSDGICL